MNKIIKKQQAPRETRSGVGFKYETDYITNIFIHDLCEKPYILKLNDITNTEIKKIITIDLQTDDALDDFSVEYINENKEKIKACFDVKTKLDFSNISKLKNEDEFNKLIRKIIESLNENIDNYKYFIIPFVSADNKKSYPSFKHYNSIAVNDFDTFKKDYDSNSENKRKIIRNIMDKFKVDLKICYELFKRTFFIETNINVANNNEKKSSEILLKEYYSLKEDYQAKCLYILIRDFVMESKTSINLNKEKLKNDPVFKSMVELFNEKNNTIKINKENYIEFFMDNLNNRNYDDNDFKEYIKNIEINNKSQEINIFKILKEKQIYFFRDFCRINFEKSKEKEDFISKIKKDNENNFPEYFNKDVLESFYEYIYYKYYENEKNIDDDTFINEKNYLSFFQIILKLDILSYYNERKEIIENILCWLSLISIEKYIYKEKFIIPNIFKIYKMDENYNPINIINEYINIMNTYIKNKEINEKNKIIIEQIKEVNEIEYELWKQSEYFEDIIKLKEGENYNFTEENFQLINEISNDNYMYLIKKVNENENIEPFFTINNNKFSFILEREGE